MWEHCASLEITVKRIFTIHIRKKNHNIAIFLIYSAIAKRDVGSFKFKISKECDTFFLSEQALFWRKILHKTQETCSFFLLKMLRK
jgi:hypothetical protein